MHANINMYVICFVLTVFPLKTALHSNHPGRNRSQRNEVHKKFEVNTCSRATDDDVVTNSHSSLILETRQLAFVRKW